MINEIKQHSRQIVVSGATGFIGQHLVPLLLNNNYQVVAVARDSNKAAKFEWYEHVQFIASDFHTDKKKIVVEPGAGLIHLAWKDLPNYNSLFHFEENLPFNYQFIKKLVVSGVSQVLITGTCFEYGFQSGPIASASKTHPNNPYALAKDCLRQQIDFLAKKYSLCFQWARLFYMYGKGQNPNSILAQLDDAIEKGMPFFNMSSGEQLRDYLPIEAVAQQLFELYESKKNGTYNICSGNPISIRSLVEKRVEQRCSRIKLNLGHYPYSKYEPMAFWGERDIGQTLYLPTLPNAPLKTKQQSQTLAPMRLRINPILNFVENEAFEQNLIDYSDDYQNSQVNSVKFKEHMASVLTILRDTFKKDSLIVEVGCGKGDFVEMVQADEYFKIKGYDESYDGSNSAIEKRYLKSSDKIQADIVVLRHVLEHIPNPYKFLSTIKAVFEKAKIYIEVPNYDWIVANKSFFDITYEHVNYFSQTALNKLFKSPLKRSGLLFDEQYQYVISDLESLNFEFNDFYESKDWKYISFCDLFPNIRHDIERFERVAHDHSIFVWGAATKGCLFLAHCANQGRLINKVVFAIDQNPQKIGKYLPGSLVKIKSKQDFFEVAKPGDLLIISNPIYKDEIVAELKSAGLIDIIIKTL
jgi:nucleoside-diphosphate-sugar epimerase